MEEKHADDNNTKNKIQHSKALKRSFKTNIHTHTQKWEETKTPNRWTLHKFAGSLVWLWLQTPHNRPNSWIATQTTILWSNTLDTDVPIRCGHFQSFIMGEKAGELRTIDFKWMKDKAPDKRYGKHWNGTILFVFLSLSPLVDRVCVCCTVVVAFRLYAFFWAQCNECETVQIRLMFDSFDWIEFASKQKPMVIYVYGKHAHAIRNAIRRIDLTGCAERQKSNRWYALEMLPTFQ